MHGSVEDTKLSTNKQHSLFKREKPKQANGTQEDISEESMSSEPEAGGSGVM
jgi:hypothetical protein